MRAPKSVVDVDRILRLPGLDFRAPGRQRPHVIIGPAATVVAGWGVSSSRRLRRVLLTLQPAQKLRSCWFTLREVGERGGAAGHWMSRGGIHCGDPRDKVDACRWEDAMRCVRDRGRSQHGVERGTRTRRMYGGIRREEPDAVGCSVGPGARDEETGVREPR